MPIQKGCTHCGSDQHNTTECPMMLAEREAFERVRDCTGLDFFDNCYWLRALPDVPDEKAPINADWELWQAACKHACAAQPASVAVPEALPQLANKLARFLEVVRECERLASSYSGSLDGVDEHGGDNHEDPICAVFHRLYYAMFDGDSVLKDLRALLAAAPAVQPVERQAEQKPVCEVSAEIYLPDGTSDFITHRLPIGTKLYTAPPAAQDVAGLVELLRRARGFVDAWDDDSQEWIDLCGDIDNSLAAHRAQHGEGERT